MEETEELPRFVSIDLLWNDDGVETHVHYLGHSVYVADGAMVVNYYIPQNGALDLHERSFPLDVIRSCKIS